VTIESDYVRALLVRAPTAFPQRYLFKRNVGVVRVEDRIFRAAIPGQCDIYAIGQGGLHYEIECKRFTQLSPAQVRWRDWCQARGVPWICLEVRKKELESHTIDRWVSELENCSDYNSLTWPRTLNRITAER
jgi:hypothetical protein